MSALAPTVGRLLGFKLPTILAFASLALVLAAADADDRRPLREAQSENGRVLLRIRTHRSASESGASCYAELSKRDDEKKRPRRVWREKLVNDVAPVKAVIHNDGSYLVTLDEYRRGGAAHAVAVYDEKGKLLRDFDLRELLRKDDWPHVKIEGRAIEWLTNARFAFSDEPPRFTIRLKWGCEIRIDLRTGRLADEPSASQKSEDQSAATSRPSTRFNPADIPPEILALFGPATSAPADQTADVATSAPADSATAEQVLRALARLQNLSQVSGVEERANLRQILNQAGLTDALAVIAAPGDVPPAASEFAGNSAAAGLGVPMPDPANPVDYVAWVLAQTETAGPSGAPLYQNASEQCVKWEGDHDLFSAALDGDPDALASPEIAAWLEANREPLELLRSATEYEYRGLIKIGEDRTMIGILLPNLSATRELTRVGVVEAKLSEQTGDYDSAWASYRDNLAIGAQVSQGPTLIENLVGMAVQRATADSLLDSLESAGNDIDYSALAAELEESYPPTRPMVECLQGERAMYLDMIQRVYEWNPDTGAYRVSESAPESIGEALGVVSSDGVGPDALYMCYVLGHTGFENMIQQGNEYYDRITAASMQSYPEGQTALRRLETRLSDPALQIANPVLTSMLPAISRCQTNAVRNVSLRNATRLVANLKAYRQQFGEYPDSLEVFGDADMTHDAFTGGSFAYTRQGDDFTLYSLGENGADDGGVRDADGKSADEIYWPRPAKKR